MYEPAMTARPADPSETDVLVRLGYDGWQDAPCRDPAGDAGKRAHA